MESKVNYTAVGLFVSVLFLSFILGMIWLSSGLSFEQYTTYLVYMKESVSGLSVDAPVEYNGVNVGAVQRIGLNHNNPQLVELYLNIKNKTPITRGTFAVLNTRGITGITYLILQDASTDLTPLRALPGQPYPVIKTAPSLFLRIDTALTKLTDSIQVVSQSIQSVLDDENRENFKQIIKQVKNVTGVFAKNTGNIDIFLTHALSASRVLEHQTLPLFNDWLLRINDVSINANDFVTQIKAQPSLLIRERVPTKLGPGEK